MNAKAIIAGFPADLFLTLVGITYLFALAQNNGTIDWLVQLAVRAVRGRIAAIPWIMFVIAALLTAVGAVSPAAVARSSRPIALGFAAKYGISPLLMGLMVVHGAQAGGFSPDQHLRRHHQRDRRQGRSAAQRGCRPCWRQLRRQPVGGAAAVLPARRAASCCARGPTSAARRRACRRSTSRAADRAAGLRRREAEALSEEIGDAAAHDSDPLLEAPHAAAPDRSARAAYQSRHRWSACWRWRCSPCPSSSTSASSSITIGLVLSLIAPNLQKRAIGQVSWPEIMLITGVSTYVGVLRDDGHDRLRRATASPA